MGFAITACVFAGVMLICCSIALAELSHILRCYERNYNYNSHYYYTSIYHHSSYYCSPVSYSRARAGVGIDSILLIIAIVEFAVALASSIYCCNVLCTDTSRVQVSSSSSNFSNTCTVSNTTILLTTCVVVRTCIL